MGRGIANTGTIYLSQIRNAYTYDSSNVVRTDTYTTAGSGSTTAPAGAVWAKVELWGGGGGGRGYSIFNDYGGSGGGYTTFTMPVTGGSTTFNYTVGSGGSGSAPGANGTAGSASTVSTVPQYGTISAWGGTHGTTTAGAVGFGDSKFQGLSDLSYNVSTANGTAGTTSVGGNAGGGGGTGGQTNGAAGGAPGGGGAPGTTSGTTGGNGAAGQVKITWYGKSTTNNLRAFLSGGTHVSPSAVGYNGNIPSSGTLKIRDFIGADELGHKGNTLPSGYAEFEFNEAYNNISGGSASGYCYMQLGANGAYNTTAVGAPYGRSQKWMQRLISNADSTLSSFYDAQFIRTQTTGYSTTLYGSAANTWIQCSTEPSWGAFVSQSGTGSNASIHRGYLLIRRRSDNTVLMNVAVKITASATVQPATDTK